MSDLVLTPNGTYVTAEVAAAHGLSSPAKARSAKSKSSAKPKSKASSKRRGQTASRKGR
jgi:hypothetical protein